MRLTIPNQLTLLRILLTPLFVFLMLQRTPSSQLWATLVFMVAGLTDWYDGWYARRFGVITRVGQFMDPLADKILVLSAFIVFAMLGIVFPWMVWAIAIRDILITINRMFAIHLGKPIITHILAKWKTAAQMGTILLIMATLNWQNWRRGPVYNLTPEYTDFIGIAMLIVTFLTIVSGIIYVIENKELILTNLRRILPF
ncbi:MAG TPA: CDP-diacylglycerol--glycerol-3-phosphate 3-phosphatidyltransferase [Calditrichia bacterium]|nr:CDP-diacylglycerol--glycerol-3-phosphate 3-phosphatidyltransferase [Calditrichota bacterium]HQU72103.1 CDP-diacylglycerol--glycerol-3-phosphate 3-phosphatidyltransferase [Calditrichia bacterium]HQV32610.1 CDP-diacylglycerol--glycerol-3-phosphate 3-phosphatidyltransferase [Calditrichia bacterium]